MSAMEADEPAAIRTLRPQAILVLHTWNDLFCASTEPGIPQS